MKSSLLYLTLLLSVIPSLAKADWTVQWSFLYHTWEDDVDTFSYSRMNNFLFFGASLGKSAQFYVGPSYHLWTKAHQSGSGSTEADLSLTEFGARFIWFIDRERTWKLDLTYNPAVKGERTVDGTSQEVDGSGYIIGVGYHLPLTKSFMLGASLYYHSVGISSYTVGNTETDASQSYTTTIPMIELALRFR